MTLAEQIRSKAKTANSRIRRSKGAITASGIGVMESGYFSIGSKKLTTAEKRQRIKELNKFIKATDTPKTAAARKKRNAKQREERKAAQFPRTMPPLHQSDIAEMKAEHLRQLIREQGKEANRRLDYIHKNKYESLLPDRFSNIDKFNLDTRGMTESELQFLLLKIRDFLSLDYTKQGIKDLINTVKGRTGFTGSDKDFISTMGIIRELVNRGIDEKFALSNAEVIDDYQRQGFSIDEIYDLIAPIYEEWKKERAESYKRWKARHTRNRR